MKRIEWVDRAKAYGIFFVFYGHLVERLYYSGNQAAFSQWKAIYSFHVPLFFVLAGFFSKEAKQKLGIFLKNQFHKRLIPVLFFSFVSLPFFLLGLLLGKINFNKFVSRIFKYRYGHPKLNWVTWFLVCLFSVEVINYFFMKYLKTKKRLIFAILFFYLLGWFVNQNNNLFFISMIGIKKNFLFINEALIAYAFYLFGHLLVRANFFEINLNIYYKCILSLFFLVTTGFTYNLSGEVVIMALSKHGHILYFPLTALAGTFFIIYLSQITPQHEIIDYIGKNTLTLLGLNGLFLHFFNYQLINLLAIPPNSWWVLAYSLTITIISIALCIPVICILNNLLPQCVGKTS